MKSGAPTVKAYLASLPEDRQKALTRVRAVIRKHLPAGYREVMQYGMIGYCLPLADYPETYNGQPLVIAGLASQKQHMALYLMGCYGDGPTNAWFRDAWASTGKKLDMGKSCLRFKRLEDLSLELIGEVIARVPPQALIAQHEAARPAARAAARPARARPSAAPRSRR